MAAVKRLFPSFVPAARREAINRLDTGKLFCLQSSEENVAAQCWRRSAPTEAVDLAKLREQDGASRIIYTDISRDDMREGVNIDETLKIARAAEILIITSGGVAMLDDIRRLLPLEKEGVEGVILGGALYSGALSLREAVEIVD